MSEGTVFERVKAIVVKHLEAAPDKVTDKASFCKSVSSLWHDMANYIDKRAAEGARGLGGDDAVHRGTEQGQLKTVRTKGPRDVHVIRVTRSA